MRYYDLSVIDNGKVFKNWTSHPRGIQMPPDAGALKIELDIFAYGQAPVSSGSYIRVWGISLDDIGRARDFNGKDLILRAGMGKGLPLANPTQAGVIVQAHIQQAFANWIGTTMTLDFIVVAGSIAAGTGAAQNFAVNWPAGMTMKQMIENTLKPLYPAAKLVIDISENLKLPYTERHFAATLPQFGNYLLNQSRRIMNTGPALSAAWNTAVNAYSKYPGVQLHVDGSTIRVFDGSTAKTPKKIDIYDLVGQPTWIQSETIQITCVMRADIKAGDFVELPPTRATVTAASQSPYATQRQDVIFQGIFWVSQVHYLGNYKDPGPLGWVTVLDAIVQTNTDATGKASVKTSDETPVTPVTGGGLPETNVEVGLPQFTGPDAGLNAEQTPAPSLGESINISGGVDFTEEEPATAGSVGLRQSLPAPSLGQSINPAQQIAAP